jgi:hypothetical protein
MASHPAYVPDDVDPRILNPIIYVRGYAMTRGEIDQTSADPFCGFNIGSTVYRATPDRSRPPRKFIFESPVVRLAKDFGYRDVYLDGEDIVDHSDWDRGIPRQSIVIYRYYDQASNLLGNGVTPEITTFARELGDLIRRVRDRVAWKESGITPETFRCYLVAHSMGGLVCRAFLQNPECDPGDMRQHVDKFFTYATPHNGIDVGGVNVPAWLGQNDINNFNRDRMAVYLALTEMFGATRRVNWLPEERFPAAKVFCLIGTNRADYEAAQGLSRAFAGDGSDGLVRIENAVVCSTRDGQPSGAPIAKAFVFRSHSGYFGIVNSEEAYQNLTRFLFGDLRIEIWLDIDSLTLPDPVERRAAEGKTVDALYQFEIMASPRGKLWYLTRRVAEEDSVACLRHEEWLAAKKPLTMHLSTVFLANRGKVNRARKSLAYSVTLGIRVPDYEVDRRLWVNDHFEGGYVFRDSVVIELFPPEDDAADWRVEYDWQSDNLGKAEKPLPIRELSNGQIELNVDFERDSKPGAKGRLRFVVSKWNI